jgi:hypothetical protein
MVKESKSQLLRPWRRWHAEQKVVLQLVYITGCKNLAWRAAPSQAPEANHQSNPAAHHTIFPAASLYFDLRLLHDHFIPHHDSTHDGR